MPNSFQLLKSSLIFYKEKFILLFVISLLSSLLVIPNMILFFFPVTFSIKTLAFIISIVGGVWSQLAFFYVLKFQDTRFKFFEPYTKTIHKIASALFISILAMSAMVSGFVLFIIPGIIIAVYLSLSAFVYFFEDLKGLDALSKSAEYIKGNWINYTRKISVLIIFYILINLILKSIAPQLSDIVSSLVIGLFAGPVGTIYMFLVYKNIKNLKKEDEIDIQQIAKRKKNLKIACTVGFVIILIFIAVMMGNLSQTTPQ